MQYNLSRPRHAAGVATHELRAARSARAAFRSCPVSCASSRAEQQTEAAPSTRGALSSGGMGEGMGIDRRAVLLSGASLLLAASQAGAMAPSALAKDAATVGTYLPPAPGLDDFVLFVPNSRQTPAIRAGTVDPSHPYRFALPPSWREKVVANISSGNYCQPRCAEPWTEVIFEDAAEGRVQVIVAPLVRLTNQANASIEDVGGLDGVLEAVGPFVTGTYLDAEDVVSKGKVALDDGLTYYRYEVLAPYGTVGAHTLTTITAKGELALMLVASASEKQWAKSEARLRKVVESFRA